MATSVIGFFDRAGITSDLFVEGSTRTAAAEAARAGWDPAGDDPRLRCVAPGMVDAMASPYPIALAQEGDEVVVIRMEEWDGVRRVHMNAAQDDGTVATPMGRSVGHWEGNTLVVSTDRISWPYFDNEGTPQSEAVEIVERFMLSDDERSLSWEAVITDPVYLTEPAVVRQGFEWASGEEIMEFDCVLPEDEQYSVNSRPHALNVASIGEDYESLRNIRSSYG